MIAIIDAGTNTFSLSVYEVLAQGGFRRIQKERFYVNLADQGVARLSEGAYQRALQAFVDYKAMLKGRPVKALRAIGTAALRSATNGPALVAQIAEQSGIEIEIVDGAREAELIYQGVRLAAPLGQQASLIMDVGGGSVEFILCNKEQVFWAQSFPVGVAELFAKFRPSDPMTITEGEMIGRYLDSQLAPLLKAVAQYPPEQLIGAAGTFDSLVALLSLETPLGGYNYVNLADFMRIHQELKPMTHALRRELPLLPNSRSKLMVVATLLVDWVLKQTSITKPLVASDHALKEGLIWEMIQ